MLQNEVKIVPMHMVGGTDRTIGAQGPWPTCVGMEGTQCKELILAAAPEVEVQIVPDDAFMTMDFRTDRVRIMVNEKGFVTQIPDRG